MSKNKDTHNIVFKFISFVSYTISLILWGGMRSLIILLPEKPRGVHTSIKLDASNETPQGTPEEDAAISMLTACYRDLVDTKRLRGDRFRTE